MAPEQWAGNPASPATDVYAARFALGEDWEKQGPGFARPPRRAARRTVNRTGRERRRRKRPRHHRARPVQTEDARRRVRDRDCRGRGQRGVVHRLHAAAGVRRWAGGHRHPDQHLPGDPYGFIEPVRIATPPASISPTPPRLTSQPQPPPPPVPPPPPATKVTAITVRVVQVFGAGPPRFRANLIVKTSGTKAVMITSSSSERPAFVGRPRATPADFPRSPCRARRSTRTSPCPRPADTACPIGGGQDGLIRRARTSNDRFRRPD